MKKKCVAVIAAGLLIALASLWIGCWYGHVAGGMLSWQAFPTFWTSFTGVCAGVALAACGAFKLME